MGFVKEQPPDHLITPQTDDPQLVWWEQTCFCPRPAAYDSSTLPTQFSPGRWTWTGTRPINILPHILSLHIPSKSQGTTTTSQLADLQMSNSAGMWRSQENPWSKPGGPGPVGTA